MMEKLKKIFSKKKTVVIPAHIEKRPPEPKAEELIVLSIVPEQVGPYNTIVLKNIGDRVIDSLKVTMIYDADSPDPGFKRTIINEFFNENDTRLFGHAHYRSQLVPHEGCRFRLIRRKSSLRETLSLAITGNSGQHHFDIRREVKLVA